MTKPAIGTDEWGAENFRKCSEEEREQFSSRLFELLGLGRDMCEAAIGVAIQSRLPVTGVALEEGASITSYLTEPLAEDGWLYSYNVFSDGARRPFLGRAKAWDEGWQSVWHPSSDDFVLCSADFRTCLVLTHYGNLHAGDLTVGIVVNPGFERQIQELQERHARWLRHFGR